MIYLGDGLYANDDGVMFEISAERNGFRHIVYLDDDVLMALLRYVEEQRGVKITVERSQPPPCED